MRYISAFLPNGEDSTEIVHDIIELNLQVFQDVAGLHTQLKDTRTHKLGKLNTQTRLLEISKSS